jgi:hypothetical protein
MLLALNVIKKQYRLPGIYSGKVIIYCKGLLIYSPKKNFVMGNLLYIIAVILIIGWLLGMFAFHAGGFIHALLVIAVILFLVKLLGGRSSI